MVEKFQRTKFRAYVKLGSRQKKLRRYKRPTGRHNKSRQKWKSHPCMVEIGYKNKKTRRNLIKGKIPIWVYSLGDLKKVGKENIIVLGKIGKKKKVELAKEILNKKLEVFNLNINKFLKKASREEEKQKVEEKGKRPEEKEKVK